MPGLVSVKTPPDAPPLRISLPDTPPATTHRKHPSPSPSRSKPSPTGKKKLQPESPTAALFPADFRQPRSRPFSSQARSGDGPNKALDYAIRAAKSFERCAVDGEPSLDIGLLAKFQTSDAASILKGISS